MEQQTAKLMQRPVGQVFLTLLIDFRPKYAALNMTNTTNTTVDFWTICREPNLVHSLIAVNTLLVVVGIFSNCLVAAVVWKVKLMQNPTNLLLSNNAIAEAIFLVISGTDLVMQLLAKDIFTLSEVLLYFEVRGPFCGVTVASFFVASINIALLAIERFNALCYPLKIRRRLGKRSTKCCIATMWLVMTILMLPLTVGVIQGQGFVDVKLFIYYCTLNGTIPAFTGFTIIYCYGRIIYGMYITKSIFNPTCSTNISEDHIYSKNVTVNNVYIRDHEVSTRRTNNSGAFWKRQLSCKLRVRSNFGTFICVPKSVDLPSFQFKLSQRSPKIVQWLLPAKPDSR